MADADAIDTTSARDAALLADTVREAGALALSMFRTELKNWTKGASSPVSEADIAVNDLLERRLRGATPDYGWLSEESVDDDARLGKSLVWIVDPIDGTRAYLAHREDWCVSVALVAGATPVLAAVFAPATDEFFFAARGQGATHNDLAIHASTGTGLDFSRMAGPKPLVQRLSPSAEENRKPRLRQNGGGDAGVQVWVDPKTYVPIKEVVDRRPLFQETQTWIVDKTLPITLANERLLSLIARHPHARIDRNHKDYLKAANGDVVFTG